MWKNFNFRSTDNNAIKKILNEQFWYSALDFKNTFINFDKEIINHFLDFPFQKRFAIDSGLFIPMETHELFRLSDKAEN